MNLNTLSFILRIVSVTGCVSCRLFPTLPPHFQMVAPVGIDPTTAADEALVIRFADYQSEHRPKTQSVSQEGTIKFQVWPTCVNSRPPLVGRIHIWAQFSLHTWKVVEPIAPPASDFYRGMNDSSSIHHQQLKNTSNRSDCQPSKADSVNNRHDQNHTCGRP